MPEPLDGKVAAVTGASSGIGQATARALARAGAAVVVGARREDRLDQLVKEIEAEGGQARAVKLDVTDPASAKAFITHAQDSFGRVDILVNNAGVMLLGPVQDADLEAWRRMVDVNVLGVLYSTHAALPIMAEAGGGHIVNISSVAGRYARPGNAVYALTKFGVGAFSEALRQEMVSARIRVTLIEPGFVDTELQGHNDPAVREAIEHMQAEIGEVLSADDIANAILYAVTQPPHVAVNEVLVRPTGQAR
jgi:NADP-dependent 3-hydroxy acid dehydrogenase YdfG